MTLRWLGVAALLACLAGCIATPITLPGDEDAGPYSKSDAGMSQDAGIDFPAPGPDLGQVGKPDAPSGFPDAAAAMDAAPDSGAGEGGVTEAGVTEGGPGEGGIAEGGAPEGGPGEGGMPPGDLATAD